MWGKTLAEGEQKARLRPARPPEVVLAAGTQVNGELKTEGDVRVDGVFEGRIEVTGWVVVSQAARVIADVTARHVQVNGLVHGSVRAVGQVQVGPAGQVWGDITAADVLVEPGGEVHPAGETPPLQPTLPLPMPAAEPPAPPVEVIRPERSPAREHLRQAEERLHSAGARTGWWPRLRQPWFIAAGAIAAGLLIVCGVLALAGVVPGAGPGAAGTPIASRPDTATSSPARLTPAVTGISPTATRLPTATPSPSIPTPTATQRPPTKTPTRTPTKAPANSPTRPAASPTASPSSTVSPYPFAPDGPVTSEYPNCAPSVVWLRGQVRNATPEQLAHVQVQARHPDGRVLTEPVQPNGSYEIRLYSQGPCPVTLVDSRDGTQLSQTVNIEYADTCNGSAFTLHWKRAGS